MPVLSSNDLEFFDTNGYVVIHNAVPPENLQAVVDAIWAFLEMDPDDPEDWYRAPHRPGGMVEMYQCQPLWDNRQWPRLYEAFTQVLGTSRLWVSIDRACMKPPRHPAHPEYDHKGFTHWDTDTTRTHLTRDGSIALHGSSDEPPLPFGVQGVLYLTDTEADQGGFQCAPGMHRNLDEWIRTQPADRNPRVPDLAGRKVIPIPGKAGDFLIWDKLLPHGNGHNVSSRPRFAQYISMFPAREQNQELRDHRINCWRNRLPPGGPTFPGDPRGWEQAHCEPAALTPLGRKLLGLDNWDRLLF